jgi:hypothetical protein
MIQSKNEGFHVVTQIASLQLRHFKSHLLNHCPAFSTIAVHFFSCLSLAPIHSIVFNTRPSHSWRINGLAI